MRFCTRECRFNLNSTTLATEALSKSNRPFLVSQVEVLCSLNSGDLNDKPARHLPHGLALIAYLASM